MYRFSDVFGGKEADLTNSHPTGKTAAGQRLRLSNLAKGFLEASDGSGDSGQVSVKNLSSATADKYLERTAVNQVRAAMSGHERPDRLFVEQLKALVGGDSYEVQEPDDAHAPMESQQELRDSAIKLLETMGPMFTLKLVLGWMEAELQETPQEEALEHATGLTL